MNFFIFYNFSTNKTKKLCAILPTLESFLLLIMHYSSIEIYILCKLIVRTYYQQPTHLSCRSNYGLLTIQSKFFLAFYIPLLTLLQQPDRVLEAPPAQYLHLHRAFVQAVYFPQSPLYFPWQSP